jgi:GNAT superfamily N-acetyltransferase
VAANTTIRWATFADRPSLEDLQRRASLRNPGDREALLLNPDAIDVPREQIEARRVLVAEQTGVIVGFAAAVPRADGDADLDALFVEPALWRHGIGRMLLEHASALARDAGAVVLHVVGNPHARMFYLACGFTLTGTVATRFGEALSMERPL